MKVNTSPEFKGIKTVRHQGCDHVAKSKYQP